MDRKEYLGDLTGARALLLRESRLIAELLLQHPTKEEWDYKVTQENILQKNSAQSAIRTANVLRRRMEQLGDEFLQDVVDANSGLLSQLLMVAVIIRTPAIKDFIETVLHDAYRQYRDSIKKSEWFEFYENRIRNVPDLAEMTGKTVDLVGRNLFTILADAGYLDDGRSKKLQQFYLLPDTVRWLERVGHPELIPVMECRS